VTPFFLDLKKKLYTYTWAYTFNMESAEQGSQRRRSSYYPPNGQQQHDYRYHHPAEHSYHMAQRYARYPESDMYMRRGLPYREYQPPVAGLPPSRPTSSSSSHRQQYTMHPPLPPAATGHPSHFKGSAVTPDNETFPMSLSSSTPSRRRSESPSTLKRSRGETFT